MKISLASEFIQSDLEVVQHAAQLLKPLVLFSSDLVGMLAVQILQQVVKGVLAEGIAWIVLVAQLLEMLDCSVEGRLLVLDSDHE